jgi:hypothetical protein
MITAVAVCLLPAAAALTQVPIGFAPSQIIGGSAAVLLGLICLAAFWRNVWPEPVRLDLTRLTTRTGLKHLSGGLAGGLTFGLAFGLVGGLAVGLGIGLAVGLAGGPASMRYFGFLLATRGRLPWFLGRFLHHSYRIGILRVSGIAYQFRHRELQDYLGSEPLTATQPGR